MSIKKPPWIIPVNKSITLNHLPWVGSTQVEVGGHTARKEEEGGGRSGAPFHLSVCALDKIDESV